MESYLSDVLAKLPQAQRANADIHRVARNEAIAKRTASFRAWKAANPERCAVIARRSKEKRAKLIREAIARLTPAELSEVVDRCAYLKTCPDWRCAYCGKDTEPRNRTIDHVISLARGGEHKASNIRPACHRCNSRKGSHPTYFA
jgi:5-methylcytosine-specific restriction endonuclease McrA